MKMTDAPVLLKELLQARSPSGNEFEAQKVLDKHLNGAVDLYEKDALGNRIATLNPNGDPTVLFAGHMDELGFIVRHIDDKGFLYFGTIGGHDVSLISGRRVVILTEKGPISGVTGKRAIHLMSNEDRKEAPKLHDIWIDIGAEDRKEAESMVNIGDVAVYDVGLQVLHNGRAIARAFDNKAGCYVVSEVIKRLSKKKKSLKAKVVTVATSMEEIGIRGATGATYSVDPHIGIAVDVTHATDHPDCDPRKFGKILLGKGPVILRSPNANPIIAAKLIEIAKKNKIPYQVEAEGGVSGTDARMIQLSRKGVATGLISIPLRYMHTPGEMTDLADIEHSVQLLEAFALAVKSKEYAHF